jgi:hypothetical protein
MALPWGQAGRRITTTSRLPLAFPVRGQDPACPRIADPVIIYIGTNGHYLIFLPLGSSPRSFFLGTEQGAALKSSRRGGSRTAHSYCRVRTAHQRRTGWRAQRPAPPAFHPLWVGQHPMRNCYKKFLGICRTAGLGCPWRRLVSLRYRSFHALRLGQRPMSNWSTFFCRIGFFRS